MGLPEAYSRVRLNALYRAIPLKDTTFRLLRKYFCAASSLYGIIPLRKLYEIIDEQTPNLVTKAEFIAFAKIARHEREGYFLLSDADIFQGGKQTPFLDYEVIDSTLLEIDIVRYNYLKKVQFNKPYYIPPKKTFLLYANPFYSDATDVVTAIRSFLKEYLQLDENLEHVIYGMIFFGSRCLDISFDTLLTKLKDNGVIFRSKEDLQTFSDLYSRFCDQTRMQSHRGHTPQEINEINTSQYKTHNSTPSFPWTKPHSHISASVVSSPFLPESSVQKKVKVGRNEPCPCGSGKKYKRCCGLG